jgi:heat shock protein HslJ
MRRLFLAVCATQLVACAVPAAAPAASPAAPLAGTRWIGVTDPSLDPRAVPWVEFVREGRLTGFTGCNMLSGSWSEQGGTARLAGVATTKRMCLGPANEVEKRVLAAMSAESRVAREGDMLVFTAPSGARFEFIPAR